MFAVKEITKNSAIADKPCDAFRGQSRSPNVVPFHMLGIVSYYCAIVTLSVRLFLRYSTSKICDLEDWVKGPWRSLKMSPFDREPMTSYWCSIITMALSRVISEIFDVEKYRDLEIPVQSQSRSLKLIPFDRLVIVSYWCFIVTLSLRRTIFETLDFKYAVTLKTGFVKVIENIIIRYSADFLLTFYLVSFLRYSMSKNIAALKSRSGVS